MGRLLRRWATVTVVGLLLVGPSACASSAGPGGPSGTSSASTCVRGTADEMAFARDFGAMALVNEATGQTGPEDPDYGATFGASDRLAISATAVGQVAVRVCVHERSQASKVVLETTSTLPAGAATVSLGTFPPGPYVVGVWVHGVVVRNLQLLID